MWLVIALSAKGLALGISLSDAAIAVSLIGLLSLREYMSKHQMLQEVKEETNTKLKEMTEAIATQNKVIKLQAEEFDKLRGTMSGIKLQFGQKETFSQPVNPLTRKFGQ